MRRTRMIGRVAALLAATCCLAAAPADSPVNVPEPDGLYAGPPKGYTPQTLQGAAVIDADTLAGLMAGPDKPVVIDVAAPDRKPSNFPEGRLWLPVHPSVPGAVWMPEAGAEPLAPAREALFYARVAELTGDDRAKPVVVFCHVECWGSWNAAKRLVRKGYTGVRWFPTGVEGWQEAHETANLRVDPAWAAGSEPQAGR